MIDNRRGENARCVGPPGNPTPVVPAVSSRGTTALPDAQVQRRVIVVLLLRRRQRPATDLLVHQVGKGSVGQPAP
jgi:hypothetical protein